MENIDCDFCEFSGNNIQVRSYGKGDIKSACCSNCIPYCFNEHLKEYYSKQNFSKEEIEIQDLTDTYMDNFIKYQTLVKKINDLKLELFNVCSMIACTKSHISFLRSLSEKKEETGEMNEN